MSQRNEEGEKGQIHESYQVPRGVSRSKRSIMRFQESLVVSLKLFTVLFGVELFCMCPFLFFVLLVLLTGLR